jgi:hypothetical protein
VRGVDEFVEFVESKGRAAVWLDGGNEPRKKSREMLLSLSGDGEMGPKMSGGAEVISPRSA